MKQVLIISVLCCSAFAGRAQFLKSDGSYVNATGKVGYCKTDGTVEDKSHVTIGYIKTSGAIEDKAHASIGTLKSDGTLIDNLGNVLGYYKTDGTLEDNHHLSLGHCSSSTEAVLRVYFFYK